MPEALEYIIDENSTALKEIEAAYLAEAKERGAMSQRHWDYYNGKHALPLKKQKDGYDDNVIINHVGALSDRLVAFLIGDGVTFDAGGDGQETSQDDAIKELWTANRGNILQNAIALSGTVDGHNAVRLNPMQDGYPQLLRLKMSQFSAFWDAFDMQSVLWYRLQHMTATQGKRIDYVRGQIEDNKVNHDAPGWLEIVYELDSKGGGPMGSTPQWKRKDILIWPFEFAPIVDWQNLPNVNGYYGKSDITGAIHLNDALNFILSNLQRIIKHHAAPKTIGKGFSAGEIVESKIGDFYTVNRPASEVDIFNLEMQSDLVSSMQLAEIITSGLWQSGGMVDPATMKDNVGQLTNFGLRVLFSDAIKRTEKKQLLYGEAFEAINKNALMIANQTPPDVVKTIWPDVLPEDEATISQALLAELERGVISMQTYRALRGYDDEQEIDRLAKKGNTGNVGANVLQLINNNRPFNRGQ